MEGASKTVLFNIAHGFTHRVPPTKLLELDKDICPYLVALIVIVLALVVEALVVPEST